MRIGVDLGGTKIEGIVMDERSRLTERLSGDTFMATHEDKLEEHMVYDSRMAYMWSSRNNQGIKFPLKEQDVYPDGFNTYQGLFLACSHWTPDNSLYGLPKINFIELTEQDILFLKTQGWFDNPTTHTVGFAIQKLAKTAAEEPPHTIGQKAWSALPKVVNYETLVEGDLVYIRL
jgi:hypothetical protein